MVIVLSIFLIVVFMCVVFVSIFRDSIEGSGELAIRKLKHGKEKLYDYKITKVKIKNTKHYYFKCKKEIEGIERKSVILYTFNGNSNIIDKKMMPENADEDKWILKQIEIEEFGLRNNNDGSELNNVETEETEN